MEIIKLLVDGGANINELVSQCYKVNYISIMHRAVFYKDSIDHLIKLGADPNIKDTQNGNVRRKKNQKS